MGGGVTLEGERMDTQSVYSIGCRTKGMDVPCTLVAFAVNVVKNFQFQVSPELCVLLGALRKGRMTYGCNANKGKTKTSFSLNSCNSNVNQHW